MADYLRGQATASVPGIRLLCKAVVEAEVCTETSLVETLRPVGIVRSESEGATLPASLQVAIDLELLRKGGRRDPAIVRGPMLEAEPAPSASVASADAFRPLIIRALGARAANSLHAGELPADVTLGLTWILSRNPLDDLGDHRTMEPLLRATGMDTVIRNDTQWRAFQRWYLALGFAIRQRSSNNRLVAAVSAVESIRLFAPRGDAPTSASQFVERLVEAVPMLGRADLVGALPTGARPQWEGTASPAIAQGLLQLEAVGALRFQPGDDSESVVRLVVDDERPRPIRSIAWHHTGVAA
jgi:hypothetical protein